VEYEDRVRIETPEGVELDLGLGGLGGRAAARAIDAAIQTGLAIVALIIFAVSVHGSSMSSGLATALAIVITFLVFYGYDVLFEAYNGGRTPGKRRNGLRVIGDRGEPETLAMAAVRNILRIVDEGLAFVPGIVAIQRSQRNQRIGDMAAGTLVVKDRDEESGVGHASARIETLAGLDQARTWDVTAIMPEELAAARRFLERRDSLERDARLRLADELSIRLQPKVPGADSARGSEEFLELLVAVKSQRI
jgi:uncharacterized RDD family membrane protein YckC